MYISAGYQLFTVVVQLYLIVLLVDFVSGVSHWAEDTFGDENTPWVGKTVLAQNEYHHHFPMAFLDKGWLESASVLVAAGVLVLALGWVSENITWQLLFFVGFGINTNQIHKWSHVRPKDVPVLVKAAQACQLIQTRDHHLQHHRNYRNSHYCVVTNHLNLILDKVRFWRILELWLVPKLGAPRRLDLIQKGLVKQ